MILPVNQIILLIQATIVSVYPMPSLALKLNLPKVFKQFNRIITALNKIVKI